jgi:hypothetical protein
LSILGTNLDYTDKDFDSIRIRAYALVESVFPQWTARQIANFGNLLVELLAFKFDVLAKYQDAQARETRWSFASQRKNLLSLVKLIGYEPATATASQVDVTLTIPEIVAGDVVFPAGSIVKTLDRVNPVEFQLLAPATILAGELSVSGVTAENSENEEDVFASSGKPNQEFILGSTPYIDGSLVVGAGNGAFVEVANFLESTSTDPHFTVIVDQNDQAKIRFGDGITGLIPTGTITMDYKIGGGSAGQVEAGTVVVIDGVFTDAFSTVVQPTVINPGASTPAVDRESSNKIQTNAPLSLRVLNRTVAREDYEINSLRLAEVSRALMLTSNEDAQIGENRGFLAIIPVGGGQPTEDLKTAVLNQVTVVYPKTLTFQVTVGGADFIEVDVFARVFLAKGAKPLTVDTAVRSNLANFFKISNDDDTPNQNIDFGFRFVETTGDPEGQLAWSKIFNVVNDTTGIQKIDDGVDSFQLNGLRSDVALSLRQFPVLGTVTIINAQTGTSLV